MAIIVKHRRTGNEYILLHIDGGGESTSFPARLLPDLFPQEQAKNSSGVTVCDVRGNIFSSYLDDLVVVEIDGKKPEEILPQPVVASIDDNNQEDENGEEGWQQQDTSVSDASGDRDRELDNDEDEDWI